MMCHTTSCTTRAIPASAAHPAPAAPRRAKTRARVAGGGSPTRRRSAGCTAPSKPAGSSTSWRYCLTVRIEESAREALAVEAAALSDALSDPVSRASYGDLSRALGSGEVDEALLPPLEQLLELTLRTGRVRKLHGPMAEAAAVRVYQATPGGRAIGKALAEVNAALGALQGRALD